MRQQNMFFHQNKQLISIDLKVETASCYPREARALGIARYPSEPLLLRASFL